jgi:hypothetical protein
MACMRRADVDPGVEETRTVHLPAFTKSAQEPNMGSFLMIVGFSALIFSLNVGSWPLLVTCAMVSYDVSC